MRTLSSGIVLSSTDILLVQIDLSSFEETPEGEEPKQLLYRLHSVLVHSGDMHGGHYFSFVRPDCETNWFKFNDERVSKATTAEAVMQNFGMSQDDCVVNNVGQRRNVNMQKKFSNAYMLVYVRASEIPVLLRQLTEKDIPVHLRERFLKEELEQQQAPLKMTVRLVLGETLMQHQDSGFVLWDNVMQISMMKCDTIARLKEVVSEITNIPPEQQRLWTFAMRENNTNRIDKALTAEDDALCLLNIPAQHNITTLRLYFEKLLPGGKPLDKRKDVLIFLKFFDVKKQRLKYMGSLIVPVTQLVGDIVEIIEKRLDVPDDEHLAVWEEITNLRIEEPDMEQTLLQARIGNGDILVFQRMPNDETSEGRERAGGWGGPWDKTCRTVPDYYDYLNHRVTVRVRKLEAPDKDLFTVELSLQHYFATVAQILAQKMLETGCLDKPIDPLRIQLFKHNQHLDRPHDAPAQRSTAWQLEDMISSHQNHKEQPIVYVEVLGYSLRDLDTNTLFRMRCPAARKVCILSFHTFYISPFLSLTAAGAHGSCLVEVSCALRVFLFPEPEHGDQEHEIWVLCVRVRVQHDLASFIRRSPSTKRTNLFFSLFVPFSCAVELCFFGTGAWRKGIRICVKMSRAFPRRSSGFSRAWRQGI